MSASSPPPDERSRKNLTLILQSLASIGQARLAEGMRVSEATISRWKEAQAEQCAHALALMGLKVVPTTVRCFDPNQIGAILTLAKERMAQIENTEHLTWEDS